tara:strand:+ start:3967 stop:5151 length:1185 start_codon:yes stop_codon:yes gene_type:complete
MVISAYQDVAERQRNQIDPTHRLQIAMLQAEVYLEGYLATGKPENLLFYRSKLQEIETGFVGLAERLSSQSELAILANKGHEDWRVVEQTVTDILATNDSHDEASFVEAMSRFDSYQSSAIDKLGTVYNLVEDRLADDYADAALGYERSIWIAGIAAGVSLLLLITGATMFSRTIISSINKLVEGAELFAKGDRDHMIEVHVPRELYRVAEEFNKMIKVIQKSENKLVDQAHRDQLTGLLNRFSFEEVMSESFSRLNRLGERFALIAVDIDHFKKVNDNYGHGAGDSVLEMVAKTMQNSVRNIDKVFRCGGEEFFILLSGADESSTAVTAERIRKNIENGSIAADSYQVRVTVSLGYAVASAADEEYHQNLQKKADAALYRAKEFGRNRVISAE